MYKTRLNKLRDYLLNNNFNSFIVSKKENVHYLTGLNQIHPTNREALLFVSKEKTILYHSTFLTPQAPFAITTLPMTKNNPLNKVLSRFSSPVSGLKRQHHQDFPGVEDNEPPTIAFEAHNLTVAELNKFKSFLPKTHFTTTQNVIEEIRQIKEKHEIEQIKKACQISTQVMELALQLIKRDRKIGISEKQLANIINQKMVEFGADRSAFPTIVAFDKNSAIPHHQPDNTRVKPNSIVLIDLGCKLNAYCSDLTRTICLGTSPPKFKEVGKTVHSAYQTAYNKLLGGCLKCQHHGSPGVKDDNPTTYHIKASDLDTAARQVIKKAGFAKNFIHTTGHALGLEIHEQPSLNSKNKTTIKPDMTITLEPGIYLKGKFGYRYENTILVTPAKPLTLTQLPILS